MAYLEKKKAYGSSCMPSENVSTYAAYFAALCTATFEVERERA